LQEVTDVEDNLLILNGRRLSGAHQPNAPDARALQPRSMAPGSNAFGRVIARLVRPNAPALRSGSMASGPGAQVASRPGSVRQPERKRPSSPSSSTKPPASSFALPNNSASSSTPSNNPSNNPP
ncbi:hypothetical protein V8G54_006854, partial [Vigna mungo]